MLQKLTPLIILGLFVVAGYFIVQGMEEADALAHPKKAARTTP